MTWGLGDLGDFGDLFQPHPYGITLLLFPLSHWPKIFNNDSILTSVVLDRLLHHAETVIIDGKSYRMKDQIETP